MSLWNGEAQDLNTALEWKMAAVLEENGEREVVPTLAKDWLCSQMLIRNILAITPANLLLVDEDGRVLAASDRVLKEVLQCGLDAACGEYLTGLLAGRVQNKEQLLGLMGALLDGREWQGELELADGRYLGARVCPVMIYDGFAALVMLDVQAADRNNAWWRRLMRVVDESREMVTRGRISGGVMHDVKNMMQNLSGNLQCMELKVPPNDKLRVRLEMMRNQIGEMNRLINSYLQMGRESLQAGECELNPLVRDTVELVCGSARMNRIEIIEQLDDELPGLCLDSLRMKQVLMNCLENSIDAILERRKLPGREPRWGEIYVTTGVAACGSIVITVEDNGVGLTSEQERRFFEPFFTTKDGGHGIGASFSRAVVELHGGTMVAANRPDGGCCVTVTLPPTTRLAEESINLYDEMACMDW